MPRSDYSFDLPQHLIAQHPLESRTSSRLLYMNASTQFQDYFFINFPNLLNPGDLLVFNNTRVIPARLFGHKASGGKIEIFIERVLDEKRVLAQLRASQSPKPKTQLYLEKNINATVLQRRDNFFEIQFNDPRSVYDILESIGHIPLPPYIKRTDTKMDSARYQTVYAQQPGAVAAPTAGLHFDGDMLEKIKTLGVEIAFITLHVGAGTFAPIRVDDIRQHTMHAERLHVTSQVCEQVKATRDRGGRVIAVGTTSVRALETASTEGVIKPYDGETRLFITPGYRFISVDGLLTNFHLPESTLLMLVCAFAGKSQVLAAYQHAIAQKYRFFSYGDAMFMVT
ncbi:MAG: tRNA preQ1(34) S-adenosylmethionine ribosyltransferase-isomerase QueA [Gammaproteobacteria bacterium]|nr:MAG: tRNA preQ1(34) S-adenosylmethionine ribosyltransferase-isomerase QueA [Gammaproteobacteria bacterium]RKZ45264.1 MAG: tRNA preQ1(34) S-adenosylmethionine ribosyltransferase-isomerase QueA [Gammaproteobacteria bacterium]RKZ77393.1 MAG: tRNA preQ1(34) S-adenosylmethionine ribosyltransferase-isomerase QueA [Gammaproteobacteria bacterium]